MFESVFQSFEKLISEFSWRRLVFLIVLLIMTATALWIWENNTGQMRLTRIERTIAILNSIKDLQEHPAMKSDPVLKSTLLTLKDDLREFTEHKSNPPFLGAAWRKAFAGGSLWILFSLLFLPALRNGKKDDLNGLIGCYIMSIVFGIIGASLPDFTYSWINYIGFPFVNFTLMIAIAFLWQGIKRARTTKQTGIDPR